MSCCDVAGGPVQSGEGDKTFPNPKRVSFNLAALIVAGFIAGNTTVATLAINLAEASPRFRFGFQLALLASCAVVALLLMPQIIKHALANLRRRRISVDLLFLMGAGGALAFSTIHFLRGEGPVYFEVFNVLLVIYSLGAFIKRKAQSNVLRSIDGWAPNDQTCQRVAPDGTTQVLAVKAINTGDRVLVRAGSTIPVDGTVIQGKAFVRESAMTGEPYLRSVGPGDRVHAASISTDAALEVQAISGGADRQLDHLQHSLHETISQTSRWQSSADRVSRWFTPSVALIALSTFVIWSLVKDPATGTMTAFAVLLVACPCAFGFATPVAVWVCASRLDSIGWRAASGEAMERLAEVDTVVFDKTGTLTVMRPSLSEWIRRPQSPFDRRRLLAIASSLQAHTNHPIASVFTGENTNGLPVRDAQPIPGVGIRGKVETERQWVAVEIGRLEDLHRPCCDAALLQQAEGFERSGHYAIAIRIDDCLEGIAIIGEEPVDSLKAGLEKLEDLGLAVHVFSGDRAERVARLGVERFGADLSPQDKADRVRSMSEQGDRILFIGDGINDVLAMSRSHVSAAVVGGADLASDIADFRCQIRDLRVVGEAISVARRSTQRLRRSLLFSISYNAVGMTIAMAGFLHPVVAVLLMMAASLTVVLRAADFAHESSEVPRYRPSDSQNASGQSARLDAHPTTVGLGLPNGQPAGHT